jgi:hypothetical protein
LEQRNTNLNGQAPHIANHKSYDRGDAGSRERNLCGISPGEQATAWLQMDRHKASADGGFVPLKVANGVEHFGDPGSVRTNRSPSSSCQATRRIVREFAPEPPLLHSHTIIPSTVIARIACFELVRVPVVANRLAVTSISAVCWPDGAANHVVGQRVWSLPPWSEENIATKITSDCAERGPSVGSGRERSMLRRSQPDPAAVDRRAIAARVSQTKVAFISLIAAFGPASRKVPFRGRVFPTLAHRLSPYRCKPELAGLHRRSRASTSPVHSAQPSTPSTRSSALRLPPAGSTIPARSRRPQRLGS